MAYEEEDYDVGFVGGWVCDCSHVEIRDDDESDYLDDLSR
jgi:hypothetical protein